jgi:hypothetical protein
MKTPAGKECHHYYEDYHRGRSKQECRLLLKSSGQKWKPSDCSHCPVPDILWANASPDLLLDASIDNGFFGIGRHVNVVASCMKHQIVIEDPFVGCQECSRDRLNPADLLESKDP